MPCNLTVSCHIHQAQLCLQNCGKWLAGLPTNFILRLRACNVSDLAGAVSSPPTELPDEQKTCLHKIHKCVTLITSQLPLAKMQPSNHEFLLSLELLYDFDNSNPLAEFIGDRAMSWILSDYRLTAPFDLICRVSDWALAIKEVSKSLKFESDRLLSGTATGRSLADLFEVCPYSTLPARLTQRLRNQGLGGESRLAHGVQCKKRILPPCDDTP